MTEKPMATHWQDGKRMVAACDAAGVHLFVVKQNRRNPDAAAAQARGHERALRAHLHGERERLLVAAPVLL